MRDKGQILMFNNQELSLMKAVFADNEDLLYIIRKVLFQFELTADEKKLLKTSMTPELHAVIRKRIFSDIDADSPLGQIGDIYQTLTKDLQAKNVEDMKPLFEAKQIEIDYLEQQFAVLKDIDGDMEIKIKLDKLADLRDKTGYHCYVDTTARNFLLSYIEQMLVMIKSLAGQKTESMEEVKKRITRDSSK